jgi:hypothetical protein
VYLPRVEKSAKERGGIANSSDSPAGNETILVVEDEAAVRELVRRVLERLGYTVLTVGSGDAAPAFLRRTLRWSSCSPRWSCRERCTESAAHRESHVHATLEAFDAVFRESHRRQAPRHPTCSRFA